MYRFFCVLLLGLWVWCGAWGREVLAQQGTVAVSEKCQTDSDCIAGSTCVEVDPVNQYSTCLLLCPTGQCLTGEPCVALPNGKKVCRCQKGNPCRSGFPCLDGFCPGSLYCHVKHRACPGSGALLCFRPIPQNDWGICLAPCQSDKDCPPPGTRCLPYEGKTACYCRKDSDCKAGLICLDYHCHTPCSSDKDCGKNEECTGTICEPKGASPPPDAAQEESGHSEPSSGETESVTMPDGGVTESGQPEQHVSTDVTEVASDKQSRDTLSLEQKPLSEKAIDHTQPDAEPETKPGPEKEGEQEVGSGQETVLDRVPEAAKESETLTDGVLTGGCGCSQSGSLSFSLLGLWLFLLLGMRRQRSFSSEQGETC